MFGRRRQHDFEDEIKSHLELEVDRLRAQGMSAEEAETAARRHFGNVGQVEDHFYHGQRFASLQDAGRDLKYGWRSLLRTPGFLLTTVGTLGLAIGAVAGMFSVVNTVLLDPLPYPDSDRLVLIEGTAPGSDLPERFDLGPAFYVHYKERSTLHDGIAMFDDGTSTFRVGDRVERIRMGFPTNDLYATLGVLPQLGRPPRAEDRDDAVLISDQLWSTWFGRDPSIVGKWFFVSDSLKQVIGVMPPGFRFFDDATLLWVSGEVGLDRINPLELGAPVVVRMKEGVTREQLAGELTRLAKELPERFGSPENFGRTIARFRAVATPMLETTVGEAVTRSLWVLLGAVAIVLLIACANVANLFMVRAEARRRELTVRRAIGASRAQLVRLQLAEAFAVALAGGVLAVLLCKVTLPLFVRAAPEGIPRLAQAGVDLSTLGATFAIVLLVALACGAAPAIRGSSPDLAGLREGGRSATGRGVLGRDLLVVGQTALALVLLIGAALLVQSFQRLRNVDPGYDIKGLFTFQFAPDQPQLTDGPSFGQLHLTMMSRLRALPGVTAVGLVNEIPLDEGTAAIRFIAQGMSEESPQLLNVTFTGGDYFRAMGIDLLAGRTFLAAEAVTPNTNAIVSRSAAERLWPGQRAEGRILRRLSTNPAAIVWYTVVGVVEDVKQDDWRQEGEAIVYFPLTGPTADSYGISSPAYVVKSPRPELVQRQVRELVHELAPEAPVYREYTMEFLARRSMIQLSFTMLTLGVVSVLAIVLGAVGLYGVLSYVVSQRTREIGVRMALGATARAVRRQVVSQGMKVVVVGVVIGLAGAYASTKLLATMLFGVKPGDPIIFTAMSALMIGTGVLASYLPARRASTVDPTEALRSD
jgi:predicted permease